MFAEVLDLCHRALAPHVGADNSRAGYRAVAEELLIDLINHYRRADDR
jgi:hypothetical protein